VDEAPRNGLTVLPILRKCAALTQFRTRPPLFDVPRVDRS